MNNLPPRPNFSPLLSTSDRQHIFGKFSYRAAPVKGNPENIVILGDWQAKNVVKVIVPQLVGVTGAPRDGGIYFHRFAVNQLLAMFAAWERAGLMHLVLTWAGSFVPRFIRGSRSVLSNHAFATAFDINVAWNPLGKRPAPRGAKGSVVELVAIANAHGFYWGGHFEKRPDGMHFEIARLLGPAALKALAEAAVPIEQLAQKPSSSPVTNTPVVNTAAASSAAEEKQSTTSIIDEIPVTEETKAIAGQVARQAGARLGKPAGWLTAALMAGNVWAWLTLIVVVAGLGFYVYKRRAKIKDGLRRILRKFKGDK